MSKLLYGLTLAVLLAASSAFGESIDIVPGTALTLDLPSQRWTASREAPAFLVEEMAEHLRHELPPDKEVLPAQITEMVKKRLSVNELFVFNSESGAHLEIDFSPLRDDEEAPSKGAIADSAKYAGQSLADEEGVSGASWETGRVKIPGAENAYRLDARYDLHGEPRRFVGVIGFAPPNWFFLYYTDPLRDARDAGEMEAILQGIALRPVAGK